MASVQRATAADIASRSKGLRSSASMGKRQASRMTPVGEARGGIVLME
jgi:hypothetical protein